MQFCHRIIFPALFLSVSLSFAAPEGALQAPLTPQASIPVNAAQLFPEAAPEPVEHPPRSSDATNTEAAETPVTSEMAPSKPAAHFPLFPQSLIPEDAAQITPAPDAAPPETTVQPSLPPQKGSPEPAPVPPPPDAPAPEAAVQLPPDPEQGTPTPQATPERHYPKIVLFSTAWCPHCKTVKEYFTRNNIPFTNRDVDDDKEALALLTEKYKSQSVPLIVFGEDAVVMNGFSEERFEKALEKVRSQSSQ